MNWFILSVVVNIIITLIIVITVMRIYSGFMAKFMSETEDRFDKKLRLKEMLGDNTSNK